MCVETLGLHHTFAGDRPRSCFRFAHYGRNRWVRGSSRSREEENRAIGHDPIDIQQQELYLSCTRLGHGGIVASTCGRVVLGIQVRSKWVVALGLWLALSAADNLYAAQSSNAKARPGAVNRSKAKKSATVSRAQMEVARQMVRSAYALGRQLETRQRVALLTRLLYAMRPDVMASEKKEWAEELFGLAQKLPGGDAAAETARNRAIATAAARLAVYDADRALDLLDTLPSQGGRQEGGREMAARLVFAVYLQHHGAAGVQTLLAHGRQWGEYGGFPYGASAIALARLRSNEDAAEVFFRQVLAIFERGQEGLFGVRDFASLLERAVSMGAISEDSAEEAGLSIVGQLRKLTEGENSEPALTGEHKTLVVAALNDLRNSSPKAYGEVQKDAPELLTLRAEPLVAPRVEIPKVDEALQSAFHELVEAMRGRGKPDELRAVISRGLRLVNARYNSITCAECTTADAQSSALVSLAALASPMTIATQLNVIEDPFWHAYFLAIAAQQAGEPTRVADPTARKTPGKEEAEPE